MAIVDKQITDLPSASVINDADLFVLEQNATAKSVAGSVVKSYAEAAGTTAATAAGTAAGTAAAEAAIAGLLSTNHKYIFLNSTTASSTKVMAISAADDGTITAAEYTALDITTQPVDKTSPAGTVDNQFSVVVAGDGVAYQWQYSADGGDTWTNSAYASAKTATLRFTPQAGFDGYQYHCIVSDQYGNTVTSDAATLTVTQ